MLFRSATWTLLAVDPVAATGTIDGAARTLGEEGWRVLAPPDGMPRVLAGRPAGNGREELYDLTRDATERHDLAPVEPALTAGFRAALDRWRRH